MSWRVKQFLRKWTPIAAMALVAWVGFTHWQRGGRANIGSVMTSTKVAVARIPVLGSYFKRGGFSSYRSGRSFAYSKGRRHGHRAHRRHHRRGRRH